MEGVVAIIFIFGGLTVFGLSMSPVGRALAERIRGGPLAQHDPAILAELDDIRADVAELHERVDFTERMLARQSEPEQLPGGA
ncbi:MAG TPA: hypothetical protein VK845_15315 [Gemmatimonadales bacterium]|nr:hypothetical protein [Gemmatimonadales bacterium]